MLDLIIHIIFCFYALCVVFFILDFDDYILAVLYLEIRSCAIVFSHSVLAWWCCHYSGLSSVYFLFIILSYRFGHFLFMYVCISNTCLVPCRRACQNTGTGVTDCYKLPWLLGFELMSSGRAAIVVNHWAISPVLIHLFLWEIFTAVVPIFWILQSFILIFKDVPWSIDEVAMVQIYLLELGIPGSFVLCIMPRCGLL